MKRQRILIAILIVVLLSLPIVGGAKWFELKTNFSEGLNNFLLALMPASELRQQIESLEKEKVNLEAQLFKQNNLPLEEIIVYSSCPFNNRSELVIGAGTDYGLTKGSVVTYGTDFLVGEVKEAFAKTSIVTTIFDPGFEVAVRIGENAVDALLRGGNNPTLELIPVDAAIGVGDFVFTASPDFPYGMMIGRVREIRELGDGILKEATVDVPFDTQSLRSVNVHL